MKVENSVSEWLLAIGIALLLNAVLWGTFFYFKYGYKKSGYKSHYTTVAKLIIGPAEITDAYPKKNTTHKIAKVEKLSRYKNIEID
jgi:hypothetical protein